MQAILWPIVSWIFREIVVKFLVFTALFALLVFLIPKAIAIVSPWVSTSGLSSAFSGLGAGVWFFLDFFQLAYGVPLMISAWVARFLIRRLPIIG